jgi:hypothetical protein
LLGVLGVLGEYVYLHGARHRRVEIASVHRLVKRPAMVPKTFFIFCSLFLLVVLLHARHRQ